METVLLVDNDTIVCADLADYLHGYGYKCIIANSGEEAVKIVAHSHPDTIITDQKMPNGDGFLVLNTVKQKNPDIPVIFLTGYGTITDAVQAVKEGAYDYIQKPVELELLGIIVKRALEYRKLKLDYDALKQKSNEPHELKNVVYESAIMRQIAKNVMKLARSNANVLIFGESGTGKELIARNIHAFSKRKDQPFIPLDCVAFPATLLESELFGFEKGAFTGAIRDKPGVFELAEGGTVFLDEITEMDFHMQAKLLRVLQERKFRRLGGKEFIKADVRIISATNRDPEEAISQKKLREDLYYRLNVVPVYIPPLRDRREDIPILVHHFIAKHNPSSHIEIRGISNKAMTALINHNWQGNVRELENVIQRIISMADKDTIDEKALPDDIMYNEHSPVDDEEYLNFDYKEAKKRCMGDFGRKYFKRLLEKHNGNIAQAARDAGISRRTIYLLMDEYGITR